MTATLPTSTTQQRLAALAAQDRRYAVEAYHFVFEALDFVLERQARSLRRTGEDAQPDRHISVVQLLEGLREYALDQFGPLARLVLERWNVYRTEDFGEIVFGLVEQRLLNKQEADRKSDFRNGFNFREAFDRAWRPIPKPAG
ncbi:MAG: hypothetical protein FJ296_05060 [Planctomycetes bacterium]|nr:hypothetical protein [Planctomycetota bacterium]